MTLTQKISAIIHSKTMQGGAIAIAGGFIQFLKTSFPNYAHLIDVVSASMLTGGGVHGFYGRLSAMGPLLIQAAATAAKTADPLLAPAIDLAVPIAEKVVGDEINKLEKGSGAPAATATKEPIPPVTATGDTTKNPG